MVAYFDDVRYLQHFKNQRLQLAKRYKSGYDKLTKLILISRDDLWTFTLRNKTRDILQQSGYPIHHPNTVIPEYSCAMHAKYEVMYNTILKNPHRTRYFCWLDIGLFREVTNHEDLINIKLPPHFEEDKIAYTDVFRGFRKLTDEQIFKANLIWVSGAFFIGQSAHMLRWSAEYLKYADHFINNEHLMNSDQQVIFSIFSNYEVGTKIKTYYTDGSYNEWFYLAYLCKE